MNENLKDILSNLNAEVDQETLLKYLQGKLTAEEQNSVEKTLVDDPFEADAVEGLQAMQDKQQLPSIVKQLNRDLQKKTSPQQWLFKHEAKVESWLLLTIVIILLLAVISYLIYRQTVR